MNIDFRFKKIEKSKIQIYLPVLGIAAGELMMFSGQALIGLGIHIINLQLIAFYLIFKNVPLHSRNVIQSLLLLILMRIINLSMPQFFTLTLLWYPLTYGVVYLPIYYIIKHQQISSQEIGLNIDRLKIYLPSAIIIGIVMALIEYIILKPLPLIKNLQISNIFLLLIIMFIFVGAVEELIFRSILQTRFEKALGPGKGIFLSGILFGTMHAGYSIISEILFACFFGFLLGYIFQRTRSFPFILTIHGITNVFLFGILPIIKPI